MLGCKRGAEVDKICRKCLIADMAADEKYRDLEKFIAAIPKDKRSSDEIYRARLEICKSCDNLAYGTCLKSGCYAEMRAIKRDSHCPDDFDRWAEIK